jgi:hypothetical protein
MTRWHHFLIALGLRPEPAPPQQLLRIDRQPLYSARLADGVTKITASQYVLRLIVQGAPLAISAPDVEPRTFLPGEEFNMTITPTLLDNEEARTLTQKPAPPPRPRPEGAVIPFPRTPQ